MGSFWSSNSPHFLDGLNMIKIKHIRKKILLTILLGASLHSGVLGNPVDFSWGKGIALGDVHRGFNSGSWLTSWDLLVAKSWGSRVSLARLQLVGSQFSPILDSHGEWTFTESSWAKIDTFLSRARENNIQVLIDLHRKRDYFPRSHSAEDWGVRKIAPNYVRFGAVLHCAMGRIAALLPDMIFSTNPPLPITPAVTKCGTKL